MNPFDTAAILTTTAAVCGYVNHRFMRLPAASGTLAVALVSSLAALALDLAFPSLAARASVAQFLAHIDFTETLMHGMLSFLLFASALHLDIAALRENKWTIGMLATVGVAISTMLVGGLTFGAFALLGLRVSLLECLIFGALISPTDPIAVMGLLRELRAPKSLEMQIAGESLFNDGIGVVVFVAIASVAGHVGGAQTGTLNPDPVSLVMFFVREVAGGTLLGLVMGYLAYRALKTIDEHALELLITLACAMFAYAMSFRFHVSGPVAVVVAGLLVGNHGRQFAMTERTRNHVDAFWRMVDEILNSVLFLLLGLQVFTVEARPIFVAAGLISIPIAILARLVSVGLPVGALGLRRSLHRGAAVILTWAGLRGGLSVAMALSLAPFPARDLILTCTYAVVVFSILVQGLTMKPLLAHYGVDSGSREGDAA